MDEKVLKRVQEHYDKVAEFGYEVVMVALQGSQNYKLDIDGSDVDTKAIVLPKFEDIVLNKKPASCTHVMDNGEHVDIKDIRLMFGEFKKANMNFVELLFTEYLVVNEKYATALLPIFVNREEIARYNPIAALKCANSQATARLKDIEKKFDRKKFSTILRQEEFMMSYIAEEDYINCIIPINVDHIKGIKSGKIAINSESFALFNAKCSVDHCNAMVKEYEITHELTVNKNVEKLLNNVIADILAVWLKEDIDNFKLTEK